MLLLDGDGRALNDTGVPLNATFVLFIVLLLDGDGRALNAMLLLDGDGRALNALCSYLTVTGVH